MFINKYYCLFLTFMVCFLFMVHGAGGSDSVNLVVNGGFENVDKNGRQPYGWDLPDGLGVCWLDAVPDKRGIVKGKAIRINTAVSEIDMIGQWKKVGLDKWLFENPQKNAIADTYGLSYYSDMIDVKENTAYRIAFDFKAPRKSGQEAPAKVWVRGFAEVRGSSRFKARHIKDWKGLFMSLKSDEAPYYHIYNLLNEELKGGADKYFVNLGAVSKNRIIKAFNKLLRNKKVYISEMWKNIKIRKKDFALIEKLEADDILNSELIRLNRYLLEYAFSLSIEPSREMRRRYDTIVNCYSPDGEWHTLTQLFHPTRVTPAVTEMSVMLYAFYPPGEYWFDNIKITEANMKDYEEQRRKDKEALKEHREKEKDKKKVF